MLQKGGKHASPGLEHLQKSAIIHDKICKADHSDYHNSKEWPDPDAPHPNWTPAGEKLKICKIKNKLF